MFVPSPVRKRHSLADMEELYIIKVILTSDPTTTDCVVMAIYGNVRHLAFCRPGDTRWTIDVICSDSSMNIDDAIYWRNQCCRCPGNCCSL